MFEVTLIPPDTVPIDGNTFTVSGGTYTPGKAYPVLEMRDSLDYGLRFMLPDDNGEIKPVKADFCRYVWPGKSATDMESRQPGKEGVKKGKKEKIPANAESYTPSPRQKQA